MIYNLFRELIYLNSQITDNFRFYTEGIFADSSRQTLKPLATDNNHGDFLKAFAELTVWKKEKAVLTGSFGRQQLSFGNQRLVSQLDWVNTRRTFDDVAHLKLRSLKWDMDLFWSRPNVILPRAIDHANMQQQFFGYYSTYKGLKNHVFDFYYLGLFNDALTATGSNGVLGTTKTHTFGIRAKGNFKIASCMNPNSPISSATSPTGRSARGWPPPGRVGGSTRSSRSPRFGSTGTMPRGLKTRMGRMKRSINCFRSATNISASSTWSAARTSTPPRSLFSGSRASPRELFANYLFFELASANDSLYNAAGAAIRNGHGRAGTNVGNEWDLVMNIFINPHTDIQLSYNIFASGSFLNSTGIGGNSQLLYAMFLIDSKRSGRDDEGCENSRATPTVQLAFRSGGKRSTTCREKR